MDPSKTEQASKTKAELEAEIEMLYRQYDTMHQLALKNEALRHEAQDENAELRAAIAEIDDMVCDAIVETRSLPAWDVWTRLWIRPIQERLEPLRTDD